MKSKPFGERTVLSRRKLLKGAVTALALPYLSPGLGVNLILPGGGSRLYDRGRIARENLERGTLSWLTARTHKARPCHGRCPEIEGYCSHTSVQAGEEIHFYVNVRNSARQFRLHIYRMGFYGGTGARLMASLGPFEASRQPEPSEGARRLFECDWEAGPSLKIPESWVSGVYLGKLESISERAENYLIFIVRDSRQADLLFQCSDLTWQAYNHWPGGHSLYNDGKSLEYWGPSVAVSFDRPYARHVNQLLNRRNTGSGGWLLWEFPLAYWMEAQGYDVTYISNLDTHESAEGLRRAKGFLSVGHDEYYTLDMFRNLKEAIEDGLNAAFFSGNTCYGRVWLEASANGQPNRIFHRMDRFGKISDAQLRRFPEWKLFPWDSPSSNGLIGAHSVLPLIGVGDWICSKPGHWIYEGTDMSEGERIPGLIGWEYHGDPAPIRGLEVVATGKTSGPRGEGRYTATIYPGPKGNFVFNASTCWWSNTVAEPPGFIRPYYHGSPPGTDGRVQRMTANVLDRICAGKWPVTAGE